MKDFALFMLTSLLLGSTVQARDLEKLVRQGNAYYIEEEFEKAVETYESVIDSGYASAELYFNLGNAYFKSHKITMALVNYHRARILDPRDEEIQHNLAIAREFVVDRIDVLPEFFLREWFRGFVKSLPVDVWAVLSLLSFVCALCLLLVYVFSARISLRKLSFWMALLLVFISILGFIFAAEHRNLVLNHDQAIIQAPSVTIKSAPDEQSGTDLFMLHEGTLVKIEDELGEWREVVLSDGNRGWLKQGDLIRL